ncbi:MAG TPA: AMIN domain-containing protein, partial [Blastocatellia bacterium]|nr:AMIN domain-containing protein [Blastocatellia bacterium]
MMINRRFLSTLAVVLLVGISGIAKPAPTSNFGESFSEKGSPERGAATGTPARQAFTLISLRQETIGPATRILLESSAPPLYTVLRPSDQLIVIDLPGGDGSKLASRYVAKGDLVDAITVHSSLAGSKPSSPVSPAAAATKIEIAVKGHLRDQSSLDGNTLVLELSPEGGVAAGSNSPGSGAASTNPSLPPNGAEKSGATGNERSGIYVYPVALKTDIATRETASRHTELKPARLLRSVRPDTTSGLFRVYVDTDGLADYKDFTLTNPARIVVDVRNVRSELGTQTLRVDQGPIEAVRVGEPAGKTVRIVIDAKERMPYRVLREGSSLVIAVGDGAGSSEASRVAKAGSVSP